MAHLQLEDIAPDFLAETTEGKIQFHKWLAGNWAILFSHPADFTPVCTTELGTVAKLKPDFEKRNVKIIALSADPLSDHFNWIEDINETQQTKVNFPIIADENKKIAELYGMIHPKASEKHTIRSVFIIGPDKKIKLTLTYPPSTGRNFHELLRVIDSLQLTKEQQLATPANWEKGEDAVISPSLSNDEAQLKFPGYKTVKPYLRTTPTTK